MSSNEISRFMSNFACDKTSRLFVNIIQCMTMDFHKRKSMVLLTMINDPSFRYISRTRTNGVDMQSINIHVHSSIRKKDLLADEPSTSLEKNKTEKEQGESTANLTFLFYFISFNLRRRLN